MRGANLGWTVAMVAVLAGAGGCALFGAAGVIAQEARRNQTIVVQPLFDGLEGKSFAVVVEAPQTLEMTYPETVPRVTIAVAERLREHSGATAYVPGDVSLAVVRNRPGLLMRSYTDVAEALDGVERLVWIRLDEFRLHDAGNRYLWNGVASGSVMVIDAESMLDDDIIFEKAIRVTYPDISGVSRDDQNEAEVGFELLRRFINRASWPFYAHEERHPEFQPY
ncbi:MAG: hypothetical protein ACF8R7_05830 [Phycisphaerales bacterium JB039]